MLVNIINRKANEVQQSFCPNIPVDCQNICKQLDIDIKPFEISAEAALCCYGGKKRIYIKNDIHAKRLKFCLAHELGHYFLHDNTDDIMMICHGIKDIFDKENEIIEMENQANAFASELIFPLHNAKKELKLQQDIDLNFIKTISEKYDNSITFTAKKMIENANCDVALLCYYKNSLRWFVVSPYVYLKKKVGSTPPIGSNAEKFFSEGILNPNPKVLLGEMWNHSEVASIIEESFSPTQNTVISILRFIPD